MLKPGDKVIVTEPMVIRQTSSSSIGIAYDPPIAYVALPQVDGKSVTLRTTQLTTVVGEPIELWGVYGGETLAGVHTSEADARRFVSVLSHSWRVRKLLAYVVKEPADGK